MNGQLVFACGRFVFEFQHGGSQCFMIGWCGEDNKTVTCLVIAHSDCRNGQFERFHHLLRVIAAHGIRLHLRLFVSALVGFQLIDNCLNLRLFGWHRIDTHLVGLIVHHK